jgi:hypothetical protein
MDKRRCVGRLVHFCHNAKEICQSVQEFANWEGHHHAPSTGLKIGVAFYKYLWHLPQNIPFIGVVI